MRSRRQRKESKQSGRLLSFNETFFIFVDMVVNVHNFQVLVVLDGTHSMSHYWTSLYRSCIYPALTYLDVRGKSDPTMRTDYSLITFYRCRPGSFLLHKCAQVLWIVLKSLGCKENFITAMPLKSIMEIKLLESCHPTLPSPDSLVLARQFHTDSIFDTQ